MNNYQNEEKHDDDDEVLVDDKEEMENNDHNSVKYSLQYSNNNDHDDERFNFNQLYDANTNSISSSRGHGKEGINLLLK